MRIEYNKLVRDRIPEIIRASGSTCHIVTLSYIEFGRALAAKLVEEASEVRSASEFEQDALVSELADLSEVMDALMSIAGITSQQVRDAQEKRRTERGAFAERTYLVWTEQPEER